MTLATTDRCHWFKFEHSYLSIRSNLNMIYRWFAPEDAFVEDVLICVLTCVFSNCLHHWMHSHTGCICLAFLHCVFSNVSANRLPEQMHSRIGCIYLAFLHCGFSCHTLQCTVWGILVLRLLYRQGIIINPTANKNSIWFGF